LLVALVAFERGETALAGDTADRPLYWVYSFLRGACYPFTPVGDHERDWYPLWPESSRGHPWD
jgi:hypothetical protein